MCFFLKCHSSLKNPWRMTLQSFRGESLHLFSVQQCSEKSERGVFFMWKAGESWATLQQNIERSSHKNTSTDAAILLLQESLCCCFISLFFAAPPSSCSSCSVHRFLFNSCIWAAVLKPSPSCWLLMKYLRLLSAVRLPSRRRGCNMFRWAFAAPQCSTWTLQLMQEWLIILQNFPYWSYVNVDCDNEYINYQKSRNWIQQFTFTHVALRRAPLGPEEVVGE